MADPTPGDLSARLLLVAQAIKPIKGLQGMDATVLEAIAALSALPAGGGVVAEVCMDQSGCKYLCWSPGLEELPAVGTKLCTTPQPSAAEKGGFPKCGCGRPGEYESEDGPACNKYFRCKDAAVGAQGDGDDRALIDAAIKMLRVDGFVQSADAIRRLAAPAAGKGVDDAALGRAYRRWYGAAKGYKDVDADAAHDFITREAALTRQPVAGDERVNVDHLRTIACEVENHRPQGHPSYGKYIVSEQFVRTAEKLAKMARNTDAPAATSTDGGERKS